MHPQAAAAAAAASTASVGAVLRAPSPDFSSFSPEELQRLEQVLEKQVEIENEQAQRLSGLRRTMVHLQQTIQHDAIRPRMSSSSVSQSPSPIAQPQFVLSSSDIVQCYICFSTIEMQGNSASISQAILCADCHRPVCRRCGNYTSPEFTQSHSAVNVENQSHTSKWRCRMCIVRREVVRKSGSWNMIDEETPAHSPRRLLQKIAAYRASLVSPQPERKSTILAESTNFFSRLWRPSSTQQRTPSPVLLASHEMHSASFDHIPESCSTPTETAPTPSFSPVVTRRMSLIREVSSKSAVNQNPSQSSSIVVPLPLSAPMETQARQSSTMTDPSFEDTTSEQPYDTASEFFSQSLDTNIDSSNPGIVGDNEDNDDDAVDDKRTSFETSLTYDERHRRLSLSTKSKRTSIPQLSSLPTQITEQPLSDNQASPEACIDLSTTMDYFSVSMLTKQPVHPRSDTAFIDGGSASIDIPISENLNHRRTSRSGLRNSHSWARKRALMQRGYEWTTTLDREHPGSQKDETTEHRMLSNMTSLPSNLVSTNHQERSSSTSTTVSASSKFDSSTPIASDLLSRRRSSRRLPAIPADSIMQIDPSSVNASVTDDLFSVSPTDYPSHPIRENSLGNRSTRSKSIDSESSNKIRSVHTKLLQTHQTQNAKSIDVSNLARRKSFLAVNDNLLPQRSLDYPYIVRKAQDLSDIVRRRMLYSKISKQQQGDNYSMSLEREHVPKVPRKIIIRQDNSIEIALSKPPKLRRQTLSEDYYYGYNPEAEFSMSQGSAGSSTLGLPMSSSMTGSNNDRRKTIETCENIYLHAEESSKLRARTPPSNPHRILLHRDKGDASIRTNGLGMRIIGGQECEDGSLGCFVTNILSGGPADVQGNIEVGDQILEFNGNSLIDSTYEEVRMLQDQCGDIVQLVVQHNNIRLQINGGQALSSMEVSRHFETVPRLSSSLTRKRRNLPPLPPSFSSSFSKQSKRQLYQTVETLEVPSVKELKPILINRGRLLAQLWHDVEEMKLALTVIQAGNLPLRANGDQPYAYITGKVLFEDRGFDMFETKVIHSSNPIYNETFVFHDVDTIDVLRLEILLWDKKQNAQGNTTITANNNNNSPSADEADEFIGIVQLPLNEANLEDEPRWYELRDRQARKPSTSNVTFKSSSTERSDSFRHMLPPFKANKQQQRNNSSTEVVKRTLHRSGTKRLGSQSVATTRKHSVIQMLEPLPNRKNRHRASIADPLEQSIAGLSNHRRDADDEDDDESNETNPKGARRQSALVTQSAKLKRRISQGILRLFDVNMRRFSELTPKSPQSPATRKLSAQVPLTTDSEDDNESSIGITIDNSASATNKSPRHSIISTTHQDDQHQVPMRSIPLQQMPIGQLMLPYIPSSRHSSISGSRKSSAASYCDSDDDIDRYFTFTEQQHQEQEEANENNNVQTHTVGPGQVTPRNYENMINDFIHMGQIQLGLIVTKGLLEIDVISARNLQKVIDDSNNGTNVEDLPPDTYVKTYLRTGTRRVQKRKTTTIKTNYNPEYHSKLKYNACNVMGRRLQVTVWQRAGKFEKNQCIGEAFIQLDNLTLTQLTVAWYKLFREKLVESEFYDSS